MVAPNQDFLPGWVTETRRRLERPCCSPSGTRCCLPAAPWTPGLFLLLLNQHSFQVTDESLMPREEPWPQLHAPLPCAWSHLNASLSCREYQQHLCPGLHQRSADLEWPAGPGEPPVQPWLHPDCEGETWVGTFTPGRGDAPTRMPTSSSVRGLLPLVVAPEALRFRALTCTASRGCAQGPIRKAPML